MQTFQILDRVMYRVEWIRHQEREKKKLEDEKEKERGWFLPCSWTLHVCFEYPSTQCNNETNVEILTCRLTQLHLFSFGSFSIFL